jgi:hypothetical protein
MIYEVFLEAPETANLIGIYVILKPIFINFSNL